MYDYMKRKTNKDHDKAQPRESGTDTVKCDSVNGKLDAKVLSICIVAVWVGHKSSRKMVKTCWITVAKNPLLRKGSFKSLESLEGN